MIAIKEQNKVFELIDFLHSKKDNIITGHYKVAQVFYDKINLAYSLKPKHALEDDTAYKEALKEKKNATMNFDRVSKTYKDKFNELGFEQLTTYKSVFSNIFDEWEKGTTNRNEALNQLRECRNKFNDLQDEKIICFLNRVYSLFFDDLCYILNEKFNLYLKPKYSGLSKALQGYLEGVNDEVIESIIDEHKLPQGADKPKWISKADGARFGKYVGLSYSQLRELFDNDIRANNLPTHNGIDRKDVIKHILSQHKVPQA